MFAFEIIQTANRLIDSHPDAPGVDSALTCVEDARFLEGTGEELYACRRALNAIAHVVGVFHPDYERCRQAIGG